MKVFLSAAITLSLISWVAASDVDVKVEPTGKLRILAEGIEPVELEPGTVRKAVEIEGQRFRATYGEDGTHMVLVLEPAETDPTEVRVRALSEIPIRVAAVEAGFAGEMLVDKQRVTPGRKVAFGGRQADPHYLLLSPQSSATVYWSGVIPKSATAKPVSPRRLGERPEVVRSLN